MLRVRTLGAVTSCISRQAGRSRAVVACLHTTTFRRNAHQEALAASEPIVPVASNSASVFVPRETFDLPTTTPSWYAGHMARAIRSMPSLLARYPPPLVIEARDARLPLTSINPVFENILRQAPTANDGLDQYDQRQASGEAQEAEPSPQVLAKTSAAAEISTWRSRRLIVYLKRDLVDPALEAPIIEALTQRDPSQSVLFVDTRADADVRKVIQWVQKQAIKIAADESIAASTKVLSERQQKRAKKGLSGAFRHTSTPEEGVRLLILGMPNVGKSSLLNGLRRVGTGKGKAASTAPHPGHTRKLTGTVRISKEGPTKTKQEPTGMGRRSVRYRERQAELAAQTAGKDTFELGSDGDPTSESGLSKEKEKIPPIYVYDTPGVMVPFLGNGPVGAERGVKLAITAGIKDSLFDVQLLTDYLLYRLNQRPIPHTRTSTAAGTAPLVRYAQNLPLPSEYLSNTAESQGRTNSIEELLWYLAAKAPGSLKKGNIRDLDLAAQFLLQHWRLGKVDPNTELDLNTVDPAVVRQRVRDFLDGVVEKTELENENQEYKNANDPASSAFVGATGIESKTQTKKREHRKAVLARKHKLRDKGIAVGKSSAVKRRGSPSKGTKSTKSKTSAVGKSASK